MTEQPRDRAPDSPDTSTSEHVVHTSHVRETGNSATGFIVGGLVVAVAIIAFILFGDSGGQQTAEINMPPEVENSVNTPPAPDAPPANSAPADGGTPSTGSTANTPPASDGGSTN